MKTLFAHHHKTQSRPTPKPKTQNHLKLASPIFSIFTALVLLIPSSVSALSGSQLDMFAQNDILFYDPSETSKNFCGSSFADCNIIGDTKDEKLWSGLRHVGFTPEQTAAIMGNMAHEGGSPTRQEDAYIAARNKDCKTMEGNPYTIWTFNNEHHSSCMQNISSHYSSGKEVAGIGLGFVQWTSKNRREGYLEMMRNLNLIQYFEGDAYKEYGSLTDDQLYEKILSETGSDSDYLALWCAAIKYVYAEMSGDYSKFYDVGDDVGTLAGWVSSQYEACSQCAAGQSSYDARVASAKQYYADYQSGSFVAIESGEGSSGSSSQEDGSNITIIGDSVMNSTTSREAILSHFPKADIYAQDSKSFNNGNASNPSGTSIAQDLKAQNNLRSNVIFALGTNDKGGIGDSNISNLVDNIIGQGHSIYFLTNYDDHDPSVYDTNNAQFTTAAATYSNVRLIDWRAAVEQAKQQNPGGSYITDEWSNTGYSVHPTLEGSELFAQTIHNSITGASAGSDCLNISDPSQAISYLQQFIVDTNKLYDRNYAIPQSVEIGQDTHTPGSDEETSPISSVQSQWLSQGLIGPQDLLGGCWRARWCGQCTALSGWFVTMMTDYTYNGGNGGEVVSNFIVANGFDSSKISKIPTAFSVFSEKGSGPEGHTGVVLGVLDDGTYLTIENNVKKHRLLVRKRDNFDSTEATFVDLSDKLKLNHLGTTYD